MYELLYTSVANHDFSSEELAGLLTGARATNKQEGITGLLVYHKREFMQLLEGEKEDVERIYSRIAEDPRHTSVNTFWQGEIPARTFRDWEMGFLNTDAIDLSDVSGYSALFEHGLSSLNTSEAESSGKSLMIDLSKHCVGNIDT